MSAKRVAGMIAEIRTGFIVDQVAFMDRGQPLAVADVRSADFELCAPLVERIVRAVNAHDALVAVARAASNRFTPDMDSPLGEMARAALRLAEGVQS